MKIQDAARKFPPFNEPDGKAEYLIGTGAFVKYEEPSFNVQPPAVPSLRWWVVDGERRDDYQGPPAIRYKCEAGCMGPYPGETTSMVGTAHQTAKIFHCGQKGSVCPPDVAAEYQRRFAAWYARTGIAIKNAREKAAAKAAKQGPGFDPTNPNHVLPLTPAQRALGVKTREELLDDARSANVR